MPAFQPANSTLQPHSEIRMQAAGRPRCTGPPACPLASATPQKNAQVRIEQAGLQAVPHAGAASGCSAQSEPWGPLLTQAALQWPTGGQKCCILIFKV